MTTTVAKLHAELPPNKFAHLLADMLLQQHLLNTKLVPEGKWWEQNLEWRRAVAQECAELSDSLGWKWWTPQTADLNNCKVECVDILHFGLSMIAESVLNQIDFDPGDEDLLLEAFLDIGVNFRSAWYYDADASETTVWDYIDAIVIDALASSLFNVTSFRHLCACFSMDFETLHGYYMGKATLNSFRKQMGYDEGRYIKVWAGREDNEHMIELVDSGVAVADLQSALFDRYSEHQQAMQLTRPTN